jgi:phosphoribosylformimino-5-aminoimidazole carboxamide ribotide isomerase
MEGPNVDATVALAAAIDIPVIASGGVSSIADVEVFLPYADRGIAGVISGRAIYDGRIDLADALMRLRDAA